MSIRATILGVIGLVGISLAASSYAQSVGAEPRQAWLAAHNAERAEFGVTPLRWSEQLEREAAQWAQRLAREEVLRHSSNDERDGRGENLWMGTAGYYSPDQMIAQFADEKRQFRPGQFPRVSTTGNWADVGHYTQIVWADTREVGCAAARGARFDILVCRYYPAGNVIGERIAPQGRMARR